MTKRKNYLVPRVGISGWRYDGWRRGKFYPKDLAQRRELEYASRIFNSIEISGSFYSLQLPSSYRRWHSETPENFLFSVKGPRYITHMKRLRDVKAPLANFFASGVLALGKKLGPILWPLPFIGRILTRRGPPAAPLCQPLWVCAQLFCEVPRRLGGSE